MNNKGFTRMSDVPRVLQRNHPSDGSQTTALVPLTTAPSADHHLQRTHRSDLSDGGETTALVPLATQTPSGTTEIAKAVALLMPGPETPGFDLCSPRSLQVWLALVHHAIRRGQWGSPDRLPPVDRYAELAAVRPSGLVAKWTVEQLAHACGVDARSAHRLMTELRDLGWLRWSRLRGDEGQYTGIIYVVQVPPGKLTNTAAHRYREALAKQQQKLDETESRIRKWRPELSAEHDSEADSEEQPVA